MQCACLLLALLPGTAALTCRPQLRATQPVQSVSAPSRSSPLTMEAADEMASLQQQIQQLQLQAEIKRLQAQVSGFAPSAPAPEVVVTPPPAAVSAADMAERIADAVKDEMPSFSMP